MNHLLSWLVPLHRVAGFILVVVLVYTMVLGAVTGFLMLPVAAWTGYRVVFPRAVSIVASMHIRVIKVYGFENRSERSDASV